LVPAPYVGGREKPLPPRSTKCCAWASISSVSCPANGDHAAVSETVNLAWRTAIRDGGLVNAVLRRMLADGPLEPDSGRF
jgi:hypothetical protein